MTADASRNPVTAPGIEINEVADGCIVYQPERDRVHYLNQTAAVVLELCNGRNAEADLPELLRLAWDLSEAPIEEVAECLEVLRKEGLIKEASEMASAFRFEIDADPASFQRLAPPHDVQRFEGIGFSVSGELMAIATSEGNSVLFYRRKPDGQFEDSPHRRIGGLVYPHDVCFAACGGRELLAVAQRHNVITIFEIKQQNEDYRSELVQEISGPEARLANSDGVAFVPPNNDYLAVCNLDQGSITFYRKLSHSSVAFELSPALELKHPSVYGPDGLAFSRCGTWLAIANHGDHSVSIFERPNPGRVGDELRYGPEPITIIRDPRLCHPHSVTFTPRTNHLIVTNAGANYLCAYAPENSDARTQWSQSPIVQKCVGDEDIFRKVNIENKMEGGPKGVAIDKNTLAVCNPEFGVEIYRFHEIVLRRRR